MAVAKFPKLSRCALHIIGTEREKARKFQEGLAPYIHNKMVPLMIIDYAEALEREMLVVPDHQQDLRHGRNSERHLHNNSNRTIAAMQSMWQGTFWGMQSRL